MSSVVFRIRFRVAKRLLAQVECFFGDEIANYVKDRWESCDVKDLGQINIESNKFELDPKLEMLFELFFKV